VASFTVAKIRLKNHASSVEKQLIPFPREPTAPTVKDQEF
jgi:hypothetical protein